MSHVNFLGIPVTGEITRGSKRVPQKSLEELAPLMQALLDDPGIAWFGWTQYTPYFNDGEPCEFDIHESLAVVLTDSVRKAVSAGRSLTCFACQTEVPEGNAFCGKCGTAVAAEPGEGEEALRRAAADAAAEFDSTFDDDELFDIEDDNNNVWEGVDYNKSLGERKRTWNSKIRDYDHAKYTGPDEARYDRCLALERAIGSGAFDDVLLEYFGDHAQVRVSRTGIKVSSYEHD